MDIQKELLLWVGAALVCAMVVSFIMCPLVKSFAYKIGAIDVPKDNRRMHKKPVPRLGGLAIFLGFIVSMLLFVKVDHQLQGILLGASIIVVLGVVDDMSPLRAYFKFCVQIFAALVAVFHGVVIQTLSNPNVFAESPYWDLGWLSIPITVLWIVGITNAVNLIDGLDGLATGICGIASFTMFSMAVLSGRIDAAALSIALFGACLAFLRYNFNPASIFLGDSGSLLLGFALGSISLLNVSRTAALTSLIIPLIVAGVPIIDTFSAIVRRRRAHISIGQADKGHIHHRLIQEGYNQKQAVLLIYAWCIMLSAGAAAINQVEVPMRVLIFTVLAIGSAAFAKHLHLFEPVLRHHYNKRTHEDELVTPDDPAFKQEEQAAEERKEERHHKL